jgi:hypothetical protein
MKMRIVTDQAPPVLGSDLRDLPRQLVFTAEILVALVHA